jgi:hypothetical protein
MTDPAVVLFGVPAGIGLALFLWHFIRRVRDWRARNAAIALRRSEWRRLNDWKPEE